MDKDSIKIMEVYKSQLVDDKPYDPRFTKPQAPKPEGVSTMQLDDFLQKNKKDKSSTDLVKAYFAQVSKILQGSDNTLKINVLLALYSFAELSGYREGLAEGRNIAHDAGKFMDNLHTEAKEENVCTKCGEPFSKCYDQVSCEKNLKKQKVKRESIEDDKPIKENEHWLHSKGNPESEDSDEDKAFDRRMAQKKWGYTNKKPVAKPRDLDKEMEARREAADQKEESKKTGADQYDESIKKTDFEVFIEALRQFGLTNKAIDTGNPEDERDISNFLFAHTEAGKNMLEITATRENDSKDDPTKKAGDTFILKGRLGPCKADVQKAQSHNPNLSAKEQYVRNGVLRMCAERNGAYVTRSFKVKNIQKIVMSGDTWVPKN